MIFNFGTLNLNYFQPLVLMIRVPLYLEFTMSFLNVLNQSNTPTINNITMIDFTQTLTRTMN